MTEKLSLFNYYISQRREKVFPEGGYGERRGGGGGRKLAVVPYWHVEPRWLLLFLTKTGSTSLQEPSPPPPLSYVLVRVIDCSLRNIKSDRSSAIKDGELFAEANFYEIYYRTVLPGILVSTFKYLSISEGKKRKSSFFVSI